MNYQMNTNPNYFGIFSEAKVRGVLLAFSGISMSLAPLIIFVLGNFTTWRNIALCWCIIQGIATISLFCVSRFSFHFPFEISMCSILKLKKYNFYSDSGIATLFAIKKT